MNLLKFVEFVIVPVANPDGYEVIKINFLLLVIVLL